MVYTFKRLVEFSMYIYNNDMRIAKFYCCMP